MAGRQRAATARRRAAGRSRGRCRARPSRAARVPSAQIARVATAPPGTRSRRTRTAAGRARAPRRAPAARRRSPRSRAPARRSRRDFEAVAELEIARRPTPARRPAAACSDDDQQRPARATRLAEHARATRRSGRSRTLRSVPSESSPAIDWLPTATSITASAGAAATSPRPNASNAVTVDVLKSSPASTSREVHGVVLGERRDPLPGEERRDRDQQRRRPAPRRCGAARSAPCARRGTRGAARSPGAPVVGGSGGRLARSAERGRVAASRR